MFLGFFFFFGGVCVSGSNLVAALNPKPTIVVKPNMLAHMVDASTEIQRSLNIQQGGLVNQRTTLLRLALHPMQQIT
mgnify:CR=1 FL=1